MTRRSADSVSISVQPIFWVVFVFAVILLPLRCVVGWFLAVAIHEMGHILAIALFRVPIYAVRIKASGTYIQTARVPLGQEVVIAAMGPVIGGIPILFSRWLPYTAVCAMVLFAFNVLPVAGFDGGRVLYGVLRLLLSPSTAKRCMRMIHAAILFMCFLATVYLRWNILVISVAVVLLLRTLPATFPCKRWKQIVQWSK